MRKVMIWGSTLLLAMGLEMKSYAVEEQQIFPVPPSEIARIKDEARSQLQKMLATKDQGIQSLVQQARLFYWVGQFGTDDDERLKSYEQGMSLLKPYLSNAGAPAPTLLWAANAGGFASLKRNLAALKLLEEIEQKLSIIASQHPAFESGAADRALADIYYSAPPFISVGSKKKALKHAQIAYKLDPHHPGNILIMAKLLNDEGEEGKAQPLFKEVLSLARPEQYPFDFVGWRAEALRGLGSPQGLKF
jgi:hypothetical protein